MQTDSLTETPMLTGTVTVTPTAKRWDSHWQMGRVKDFHLATHLG